ncbi:MAG: hypothetical protein C7B45_03540 [Sulfobacillus acidophilus]|uniref:Uncharacterized protein n=1 Tax=Sulfobacillus acidophilus TaxID=53633 RepID=A0A2T2WMF0_9FIRM|nr:MAG: hypothetical protein C7B45_03540 [Sulfobacillus acidophilus]
MSQTSVVTVTLLPRWFPGRRRFVVWNHGFPRLLQGPNVLALLEGMTLEEFRLAGDPEPVVLPYLSRVHPLLQGEPVPPLFGPGQAVTIHPDPLDDQLVRWISSTEDQQANRHISLTLEFAEPPQAAFIELVSLTLQIAVNGDLSTTEGRTRLRALVDAY